MTCTLDDFCEEKCEIRIQQERQAVEQLRLSRTKVELCSRVFVRVCATMYDFIRYSEHKLYYYNEYTVAF